MSVCPLLSISDRSVECCCLFLSWAVLARVYVTAAPGIPSAQPLQKGHRCFLVRIPLQVNTWGPRSLLDSKGNRNSYPQFGGILGLAGNDHASQRFLFGEETWEGLKVAPEIGEGVSGSPLWMTTQFLSSWQVSFYHISPNFLKIFCCHLSDKNSWVF